MFYSLSRLPPALPNIYEPDRQVVDAGVDRRRDPALAMRGREVDPPALAAPGAEDHRRATSVPRPGAQRRAIPASPARARRMTGEQLGQRLEAALAFVGLDRVDLVPGRATAEAEAEAAARQDMQGLGAVRQLDGLAQRHLHHAVAKLDALGHAGQVEEHERIEHGLAAREGVDDPAAGEAQALDALAEPDHARQHGGGSAALRGAGDGDVAICMGCSAASGRWPGRGVHPQCADDDST